MLVLWSVASLVTSGCLLMTLALVHPKYSQAMLALVGEFMYAWYLQTAMLC